MTWEQFNESTNKRMKGFGNAWNLWRYFTCTYNMEIGFMIFNKFKSSGDTKSWSLHLFKQFDTMCFVNAAIPSTCRRESSKTKPSTSLPCFRLPWHVAWGKKNKE